MAAGESFAEFSEAILLSAKSRKRKREPEKWAKNIAKSIKYKKEGKTPSIACGHAGDKGVCKANRLTHCDIQGKQDIIILFELLVSVCVSHAKGHAKSYANSASYSDLNPRIMGRFLLCVIFLFVLFGIMQSCSA